MNYRSTESNNAIASAIAVERSQSIGESYPQANCIHQLFEAQVDSTPDAVALVFKNQQLTYRELNERANQLAHQLQTLNVGPEMLVGLSVERSLELVIGILGILKAGGAYVPLDPAYPPERLAYMLADAQVGVLVTVGPLGASLETYSGQLVDLDRLDANLPATNLVSTVTAGHLSYIIYTSGSTGQPKGVMVSHGNITRLFTATQDWYQFDQNDVWTMFHSYAFDFSVWELWGALIYGGRLVIVPFEVSRSPQEFYELLAQEGVTVLNQTPSAFCQLMEVTKQPRSKLELSLRLVIFGGEALNLQSLKPWFDRYGDQVPQLVNMYGITETTVHVTYRAISRADLDRGSMIGCPIPDLELYILDRNLQPVGSGVAGELYVGGAGVARGYLHRPELTAERFIPHLFSDQTGAVLYKTGDLARFVWDGDIEYLGRIDNQVKLRGFRIELGEIEAAVDRYPGIRGTVAIIREDRPGDRRLVAYVVADRQTEPTEGELRTFIQSQLPDYMLPSAFVLLDRLPLTLNGKVDRKALPAPESNRQKSAQPLLDPRDELEVQLTNIWEQVLGIQPIGIDDNFFELGGHSLLAVRLFVEIEREFGRNLPLAILFQHQTIAELAGVLRQAEWSAPWSSLVTIRAGGAKPPLFCVHPIGGNVLEYHTLANYLDQEQPVYGLQSQGLDGQHQPLRRVEEMASLYIKELRTIQPHGPYLLLGYSFGGLVTFEIAQQLAADGEQIALLAMLDCSAPHLPELRPSFIQSVGIHLSNLWQLNSQERSSYILDRITYRFRSKNGTDFLANNLYQPEDLTPHLLAVLNANLAANHDYIARSYPGRIDLFRCQVQDLQHFCHPQLGWESIGKNVVIHPISSPHFSMLKEPRVQGVAAQLKICLQKLQPDCD